MAIQRNEIGRWYMRCDGCGHEPKGDHEDPGEIAEGCRRIGYTTKPLGALPSVWYCFRCTKLRAETN